MQETIRDGVKTVLVAAVLAVTWIPEWAAGPETAGAAGSAVVALVNGESITLDEYLDALAEMHAAVEDGGQVVERKDPTALLERLVNLKLVLQEAQSIGLQELPEFESSMAGFRAAALRSAVLAHAARQTAPVDPQEIERVYRGMVEEVEVSAVIFEQRAQADAFAASLAEGEAFAEAGPRFVADGLASLYDAPRYIRREELLPSMVAALDALEPDKPSPVIDLGKTLVVFEVTGRRIPEDGAAREAARQEVVTARRARAISDYLIRLREARVQTDDALIASIDFDSDAKSFEDLLQDERVLIRVADGEPIRVRDVAGAIGRRLFHGVEQAARKKRLDRLKGSAIEQLISDRMIEDEARRLNLAQTEDFEAQIDEYRKALLFGMFVGKVIAPSVKVTPEEAKSYYDRNLGAYTRPEMVRLERLTFAEAPAAQRALERLIAGADLQWMRVNAEGQVAASDLSLEETFDNRILLTSSLPQLVREALIGAEPGDVRLSTQGPERHHVLVVGERFAGTPQAFADVQEQVQQQAYAEKQEALVEDWIKRLREASEISLLVDGERLRELTRQGLAQVDP